MSHLDKSVRLLDTHIPASRPWLSNADKLRDSPYDNFDQHTVQYIVDYLSGQLASRAASG